MEEKFWNILWLDDERDPETGPWMTMYALEKPYQIYWVKSYKQFTNWVMKFGVPDQVSFDNDLGDPDGNDGIACLKYIINYIDEHGCKEPCWSFQTNNTPAKEYMISYIQSWRKSKNI